MPIIAPSILAADFGRMDEEIQMLNRSEADWVHVDVMDGRFVPNISFGFPVLKAVKKQTAKFIDVHLMIVEPDRWVEQFVKDGADLVSVHLEADPHLHRTLSYIRSLGAMSGVAINPSTPVQLLAEVLELTDLVCMMAVNPGFGGQSFIENTYKKVRHLKQMIREVGTKTKIQIDGGVTNKNAQKLLDAGADVLVAGSYVFKADDPCAAIKYLKECEDTVRKVV